MRLLDRYLLRELLIPLGYCLCGFFIFWVSSDLFADLRELQKKKLLLVDIAQLYLVKAPEFLVVVLPVALLLALLYALTNHARHHEITAIRAAGVSIWRLLLPYMMVGLVCSVALMACNELWVPDAAERAEAIKRSRVDEQTGGLDHNQVKNFGFTNSRDNRLWQIGLYDGDTGEMIEPQIIWERPDGARIWIKASRGWNTNGVWVFSDVRQFREQANNEPPLLPILNTNLMAFPEFGETLEMIQSEMRITRNLTLRGARKADLPAVEIINYLRLHPNPSEADANWLFTKLHGRLAMPWTCLVVVLIAVPFGAASGRRNVFMGVAGSIIICFTYFVMQQLCLALGAGGHLPPWLGGWLPNIAFGAVGLVLTARVR